MKLNILIMIAIVLVTAGATYWFQTRPPHAEAVTSQSQQGVLTVPVAVDVDMDGPLPDFKAITLDGDAVESSALKGKMTAINLWATWCPPCVAEFPKLLSIARENQDDFVLLFISSDMTEDAIDRFVAKLSAADQAVLQQDNVIMVWDETGDISSGVFKVAAYPETILVDAQGQLIGKLKGADWDVEAITQHIGANP